MKIVKNKLEDWMTTTIIKVIKFELQKEKKNTKLN
jgi:hypothetical protein